MEDEKFTIEGDAKLEVIDLGSGENVDNPEIEAKAKKIFSNVVSSTGGEIVFIDENNSKDNVVPLFGREDSWKNYETYLIPNKKLV